MYTLHGKVVFGWLRTFLAQSANPRHRFIEKKSIEGHTESGQSERMNCEHGVCTVSTRLCRDRQTDSSAFTVASLLIYTLFI